MSRQTLCRIIRKQYQAFLDEELEREMLRKIRQHLEECPDCKVRVQFEARFHTVIRKRVRRQVRRKSVPDRLRERIRSQLF